MALNTNLTTQGSLSPTMQTFFDKLLLKRFEEKLVHAQFGQKRPIPRNNGKTIQFRRFANFAPNTTPLTEGIPPDGKQLSISEIIATVAQYGDFVAVSDLLDLTALDPIITEATKIIGYQGGESVDQIVRTVLNGTTNVMFPNGKTARASLAAGDKVTTLELRRAVTFLKKKNARPFPDGYYVAIVGPSAIFDLQSDPLWQDVSKYSNATQIYKGEIGRLFQVRFVETNLATTFTEGVNTINGTLVLGADAYGIVSIDGGENVKLIVKAAGSAGTADPLNQVSTVGWKVNAFTAKILYPDHIVRIESFASI